MCGLCNRRNYLSLPLTPRIALCRLQDTLESWGLRSKCVLHDQSVHDLGRSRKSPVRNMERQFFRAGLQRRVPKFPAASQTRNGRPDIYASRRKPTCVIFGAKIEGLPKIHRIRVPFSSKRILLPPIWSTPPKKL